MRNPLIYFRAELWSDRLIRWWIGLIVGLGIIYLINRLVSPESTFIISYLASLFGINSLLFLFIKPTNERNGWMILIFLTCFEVVALIYYALASINANV